jgi:hypothetical protein
MLKITDFYGVLRDVRALKSNLVNICPHKLSLMIRRVNKILGIKSCLNDSLCLFSYIKDNSSSEYVIGVKKDNDGNFESHAWVEIDGNPINEKNNLTKFIEIYRRK